MTWAAKLVGPLLLSVLLTPLCLFIAAVSAGAGHGDNRWGYILFPYTMLIRGSGPLTPGLVILAVLQLPAYAFVVGIVWASGKSWSWLVVVLMGVAHIIAAYLCFPH